MADGGQSGGERIARAFERAAGEGRAALMPYLMGGFPDPASTAPIAAAYVEGGADLIELGVPFSDPLADGPVIHSAATRALQAGATLESVLDGARGVVSQVPVVAMLYVNVVVARGVEQVADALARAGIAAAIVPDLPLEDSAPLEEALAARGLCLIRLVAPTTPPERLRRICESASGFVYVVSDTRTTGERDELAPGLAALVGSVREAAPVPAAVGFGITTPEQAAEAGSVADGVIIGSRLVRAASEAADAAAGARAARDFLASCREALTGTGGAAVG